MAISFESPAPAGFTDLAARYGRMAAQGAGQGNAANAAFQSNIAEAAMQQQTANQNRELQASTASADRTASLENAGRQRQFQLQQNEQENQQRQEQMKTQAQLQVGVQEAELSTKERIDMQRMKNTLGEIDSSNDYTPEEKTELKGQIKYKLSGYQMRDAHAKMLMQQQALQDMHEQRAHALALETMDGVQRAKAAESQLWHRADGNSYQLIPGKGWSLLEKPKPDKAEKPPTHNPADFDFAAHEKKAMAEAKAAYPAKDDEEKRNGYYQDILKREQTRFDRGEMTIAGQKKGVDAATGSQPVQPAAQGQPQGQPQQQAVAPPPQLAREQPPAPDMKPFNLDDFSTMNPKQKQFRSEYMNQLMAIQGRKDLPAPVRQGYEGALNKIAQMVASAGGKENLTLAQRDERDRLIQYIASMPGVGADVAKAQGQQTQSFDNSVQNDARKAFAEQNR